eukprot:TRINITY_DN15190_c0_g1_i1.p1 TRINITY_DN15190_c0_g1~~TRINITY_DN15190_c0_g1_i1.p1  ORF type:complete len:106 (+),score=19.67 TRINITY_DN15190_c0_g1_i1:171-488(+)
MDKTLPNRFLLQDTVKKHNYNWTSVGQDLKLAPQIQHSSDSDEEQTFNMYPVERQAPNTKIFSSTPALVFDPSHQPRSETDIFSDLSRSVLESEMAKLDSSTDSD